MKRIITAAALLCLLGRTEAREPVGQVRCAGLACGIVMSDPRPRAWCGWWLRRQVRSDPGAAFNVARAWAHWGRSASPGPGVIVVWPHHVGVITGRTEGGWIIRSGNDGNQVRERPLSIARAIAFRTE
jgi:hypothetical protein